MDCFAVYHLCQTIDLAKLTLYSEYLKTSTVDTRASANVTFDINQQYVKTFVFKCIIKCAPAFFVNFATGSWINLVEKQSCVQKTRIHFSIRSLWL